MARQRSDNFNLAINMISSIGVLVINLCVSFFLSPYIIRTIGVEANGFVTLANNLVGYADLVVTALNGMAARFITIAYVQKDYKKANLYYNSVFWGNLIIVGVLLIPAAEVIVRLQYLISVPEDILIDIKILFSLVFIGFFIRTGAPNYDCGTYVKNRLDLFYLPTMGTALFRAICLVCLFSILVPHVWYVSLVALAVTLIKLGFAKHFTHTLTPELKVDLKNRICSFRAIRELVGSGIWNSISSAGYTLLIGLDLLVCNEFIGATEMGILSLSKILPNILLEVSDSIRGAFGPELTISFAKGDRDKLLHCLNRAMKITSVIVTIPAGGLVVMSDAFYRLWVPSQDARLLQVLTSLAILSYLVNSGVVILFNAFSTANKVMYNSVAMLVCGIASIAVTLGLIYYTNLDIYAVAGVSSIMTIVKNLVFTVPVGAKLLGFKWNQFYPQVGISTLCCGLIIAEGLVMRIFMPVNSWSAFLLTCFVVAVIGFALNIMIVLNKEERAYLVLIISRKLHLNK